MSSVQHQWLVVDSLEQLKRRGTFDVNKEKDAKLSFPLIISAAKKIEREGEGACLLS
jgi:hypothetical protein